MSEELMLVDDDTGQEPLCTHPDHPGIVCTISGPRSRRNNGCPNCINGGACKHLKLVDGQKVKGPDNPADWDFWGTL